MTTTEKLMAISEWTGVEEEDVDENSVFGRLYNLSQIMRDAFDTLAAMPSIIERENGRLERMVAKIDGGAWNQIPHLAVRFREGISTAMSAWEHLAQGLHEADIDCCAAAEELNKRAFAIVTEVEQAADKQRHTYCPTYA